MSRTLKFAAALAAGFIPAAGVPVLGIWLLGISSIPGIWLLLVVGFVSGLALALRVDRELGI